jgi:hypothetical protein
VLGAVDTACTVKNTARAVEAAAKIARAIQLAGYAMVFLTFADQIKAGTATAAQAETVGKILTTVDTEAKIVNETSTTTVKSENVAKAIESAQAVPNPNYGKNALDSQGYQLAAYGAVPKLDARGLQYTIGGGALMGTLSGINTFIKNNVKGDNCKLIQNNWVRVGSILVGIVAGAVTLGGSLVASVGVSVGIGMALPILENYLAQMVAGTVVSGDTSGVDAGNAIFSGTAALLGTIAMGRGMQPVNKERAKEYAAITETVRKEYVALETEAARSKPLDITERYSFLGSLVRTIYPSISTSATTLSGSITKLSSLLTTAASAVSTPVKATKAYNEARYSQCKDEGYAELGITADVFCNVRYSLTAAELALDTDEVIEWMLAKGYVDENGEPKEEYAAWKQVCVNRTAGWGEVAEGEEEANTAEVNGTDCIDGKGDRFTKKDKDALKYFRVYTMDSSIIDAMDYSEGSTDE